MPLVFRRSLVKRTQFSKIRNGQNFYILGPPSTTGPKVKVNSANYMTPTSSLPYGAGTPVLTSLTNVTVVPVDKGILQSQAF